ncbi:hypothetical protein [Streptomyces sp. PR69]|uniref:hypothetical protein n=1 Tax=Streptomyces sp. PR69 TaxID=2984950 RepID=UPI002263C500|nr:hypothetical protein [Streptomyces sp. PR69]
MSPSGTKWSGGGWNVGTSCLAICDDDCSYDCDNFRISAAASSRCCSRDTAKAASAFSATTRASGSFRCARAASRLACADPFDVYRGIPDCAAEIDTAASLNHFDASSL